MKEKIARLFASLLVDQWPIPAWLRRRLESNHAVASAIVDARNLENRLRENSGGKIPVADSFAHVHAVPNRVRRRPLGMIIAATAASLLACAILWQSADDEPQGLPSEIGVSHSIDPRPILASLLAGQIVVDRVSAGIQNVAVKIANASDQIGSQVPIRLLEDLRSDDEKR